MNKLSTSSKNSMHTREITGAILVLVLIPCILFGNWYFFSLILFLSIVGIHEILKAPGPNRYNFLIQGTVYVFVLSFIFWGTIKNYLRTGSFYVDGRLYANDIFVSVTGIILYALILFLIAISTTKIQLSDVTYLFTIGIVFALGMQGMLFLRFFPNNSGLIINGTRSFTPFWGGTTTFGHYFSDYYSYYNWNQSLASCVLFAFMLLGTWISDVGAYFFGTFFGKHRMNPRISPHKTWEGFFGGIGVSVVFSLGAAAIMEYCFHMPLVPGLIQFADSDLLKAMGLFGGHAWPMIVLLALMMPIVGNIGGFLFSLVKRQFGLKDFGKLFPGHGGVIDRFDSVMINSIALSIIIFLTANGWSFVA
ncbi:MAG: phosphatidate cytidylyltransferase [Bacilli bacterium]